MHTANNPSQQDAAPKAITESCPQAPQVRGLGPHPHFAEEEGTEPPKRLSSLPKVTRLIKVRTWPLSWEFWLLYLFFLLYYDVP